MALLASPEPNRILAFIMKQCIFMPMAGYVATTFAMSLSLFIVVFIVANMPRCLVMVFASRKISLVDSDAVVMHQVTAVFLFISLIFTVLLFYAVDKQNRTIFSLMTTQVALHEIRIEEQQARASNSTCCICYSGCTCYICYICYICYPSCPCYCYACHICYIR